MPTTYIELYSADEDRTFRVREQDLKQVAKSEFGMVEGPFELNLFTKTVLATALQREQIQRNDELRQAMTVGGDWREAQRNVQAVNDLMEKIGIENANWTPTAASVNEPKQPKPTPDASAQQTGLNLDGQVELSLD